MRSRESLGAFCSNYTQKTATDGPPCPKICKAVYDTHGQTYENPCEFCRAPINVVNFLDAMLFENHEIQSRKQWRNQITQVSSTQISKPSVFSVEDNQDPALILKRNYEASHPGGPQGSNGQGSVHILGEPAMVTLQGRPEYPNQPMIPGKFNPQGKPDILNQPAVSGAWDLQGKPGSFSQQGLAGLPSQQGIAGSSSQQGKPGSGNQQGMSGSPSQQGISGSFSQQGMTGSSSQQGKPGSSSQQGKPGSSNQQGKPGSSSQQGKPGSSSQQGNPGSPSQQGKPGSPSQQGKPGSSSQQGKPGSSSQQGKPGSSSQHGKPGSSSQQGKPGSSSQQGKPGSSSQPRKSRSLYKQGERKHAANPLNSNKMDTQIRSIPTKNPTINTMCESIYKPVCGSNGKTYGNNCLFKEAKRLESIKIQIVIEFLYAALCVLVIQYKIIHPLQIPFSKKTEAW
ncbi:MARCO-like protein [Dipodomys spectabilis]|uniref:MARCO-like protein n=1 Tax=Dipodomys spectabilis TaxID=105255 RepID=UPI001C54956D|nr:MARCO-like protein [Dipodomys spectabilis]